MTDADAYILHIGTAPDTWDVVAAGLLTQTTYLVTAMLPTDVTLYVRVGIARRRDLAVLDEHSVHRGDASPPR